MDYSLRSSSQVAKITIPTTIIDNTYTPVISTVTPPSVLLPYIHNTYQEHLPIPPYRREFLARPSYSAHTHIPHYIAAQSDLEFVHNRLHETYMAPHKEMAYTTENFLLPQDSHLTPVVLSKETFSFIL